MFSHLCFLIYVFSFMFCHHFHDCLIHIIIITVDTRKQSKRKNHGKSEKRNSGGENQTTQMLLHYFKAKSPNHSSKP